MLTSNTPTYSAKEVKCYKFIYKFTCKKVSVFLGKEINCYSTLTLISISFLGLCNQSMEELALTFTREF